MTHFSAREKNNQVKVPFTSKPEVSDDVSLWSTVDEEAVTVINTGTLKQAGFRFMRKTDY